ncbi:MAG: MFS transporter [Chloroflexota bacterium]|nr:MFS transporter [Chloroflexota bacterium]
MNSASTYVNSLVGGLPRTFWWLWLGTLINRLGIFVIPFLTLFLTRERGFSEAEAGAVIAPYGIGALGAHLIGGYLSDRIGRRLTMLISFFVTPVLVMLLYGASEGSMIAVIMVALGFFMDLYRPASSALIADVVPAQDRLRAYSLRYWAINLGAAVALALAGYLAQRGYALLFIGDALTTFLFGLVILFFVPETRPQAAQPSAHNPSPSAVRIPSQELPTLVFVVAFTLLTVSFGAMYTQFHTTMPLAMKAEGLSEFDYGWVSAINGLVIVLVSLQLNRYLARFSPFLTIAGAAILSGIGFGFNALATTAPLFVISVVIFTFGELIANPVATTLIADVSPTQRRGFYQGIFGASWGMANFVGPLVGGSVYQQYGGDAVWALCLVVGIVLAIGYLTIIQSLYLRARSHMSAVAEGALPARAE